MKQLFINLRTYSDYSLGYGAIKITNLVEYCVKRSIPAVAVTDRYNLFSSLEFAQAAVKKGMQPIMGCVINIVFEQEKFEKPAIAELLLLAKDEEGYANLLKIVSDSFMDASDKNMPYVSFQYLKEHAAGFIVLCGTLKSPVGVLFLNKKLEDARSFILELHQAIGDNLYIELMRRSIPQEEKLEEFLLELSIQYNIPIVATNEVCFLSPDMTEAHDALICIATGENIYAEQRVKSNPQNYFKSGEEMSRLFIDLPEAIANTEIIARRISVFAESREPLLPRCTVGVDEEAEITQQAIDGLKGRLKNYVQDTSHYFIRLDFELSIIKKMNFSGYFLIVSDFIKWSKKQGIPVGPGRGSGAGSIVAWALQITDLDPIRFGLLFERFLNPDRVSMPDFDIDFCQDRREEVIQYVRGKYGSDRVASIITFGKLQAKAVLRDVGRVLGMGFNETDKICKMVPNNPANPVTLQQAIDLDKDLQNARDVDPRIKKLLEISLKLEGMNRHASTHAAGVVIADRPLYQLAPLYKDDSSPMPIIQYAFKYAEVAGLVKFDFLGLKTLTMISWAVDLIKQHTPDFVVDMEHFDDAKTYELLSQGKTVGVFQFESAGMRDAIKKLRPDSIEDLIALGSLYRPGPMDNIPSYINRKHGIEKAEYINPILEPILKETYGIIVYQEQVMQIAQSLAGYTLGSADLLRRAMGKKNKAEMEAQRDNFVKGAIDNNVDRKTAVEIFNLVDKFASYGFNKSHAAAYAIISYHTAYLKANHPLEFLASSINLEINDTEKIQLFCEEGKSMGIKITPPDINLSHAYCTIKDGMLLYGLGAIKNVGIKAVEQVVQIRSQGGDFTDIHDFITRCGGCINRKMIERLVQAGAFNSIASNQRQLYDNSELILRHANGLYRMQQQSQKSLFGEAQIDNNLVLAEAEDWSSNQKLEAELESLGFYLSTHPLSAYAKRLAGKTTPSNRMADRASKKGSKIYVVGVITSRKIRSSPRGRYAFIQLSDLFGLYEVSVFNEELLNKHTEDLQLGKTLYLGVDARKDDNGLRFIVESIRALDDFITTIPTMYTIHFSDVTALKKLTFSDNGVRVRLVATVDGHKVLFDSKKPLKLSMEELAKLYDDEAISITEDEIL